MKLLRVSVWKLTLNQSRFDRLERRIIQLKLEQQALQKEEDEASRKRLEMLEKELSDKRT